MKTYRARSLVSGHEIGLKTSQKFIAIPDHYDKEIIKAMHGGREQLIENWDINGGTKSFNDKFGRGVYTLYYFEWDPKQETLF